MATDELETKPAAAQELVTFSIQPIRYEVTKAEIEKVAAEAKMLRVHDVNDKKGIELCHKTRMQLRDMRLTVEKKRKLLKAESLEYGRQVDSLAKELIEPIEDAESHLQDQEDIVKREQERLIREAEEKRQAIIRERLRLLKECDAVYLADEIATLSQDEFDELLTAERKDKAARDEAAAKAKAEQERVAAEQKAEADRLEKERAELDRRQQEAETRTKRAQARWQLLANLESQHQYTFDLLADMSVADWEQALETARRHADERNRKAAEEQAKLDRQRAEQAAEQRRIEAENDRIYHARVGELAKYEFTGQRYDLARDVTALDFDEILRQAKAAAEREAAERKRIEALRPDAEKLRDVADAVGSIEVPGVSKGAAGVAERVRELLDDCAADIRELANQLVGSEAA